MLNIGSKIGRWLITAGPFKEVRRSSVSVNYIETYECLCDCGVSRRVRYHKLLRNSKSCGCWMRDQKRAAALHGHNRVGQRSRLYCTWDGMHQRTNNPNHNGYDRYGGRGISMDATWRDFSVFADWARQSGYRPELQIDRINNDGPYAPHNCRWVTDASNKRNTSRTRLLTAFNETKCLTDWSLDPRCAVMPSQLRNRLRTMSPETAITVPRQSRKKSPRFQGHHIT